MQRTTSSEIRTFIKRKYPEFESTIEEIVEWIRVLIDHNKVEGLLMEKNRSLFI